MRKEIGLSLLMMMATNVACGASLVNGDFSSGSTAWTDASSSGSVTMTDGYAQLDTGFGVDPYSSILVQGDDGFFNFASPISIDSSLNYLSFDVSFIDLGIDATESGGSSFTDHLLVSLYDAVDFTFDQYIDPIVDIDFGDIMTRITFDISGLSGRDVALSFELVDENDGRNSRILLDNVAFTSNPEMMSPVPLPPAIYMFFAGLGMLFWRRKKAG